MKEIMEEIFMTDRQVTKGEIFKGIETTDLQIGKGLMIKEARLTSFKTTTKQTK